MTTSWTSRTEKNYVLREDGGLVLREDGTKFLREESYDIDTQYTTRIIP